ncbi:MAG: nitronate monooxygenase family protein [Rickettsiales bacterium]|nr:nitronate monooxygenase family protein [Rickettsiales bacterium]
MSSSLHTLWQRGTEFLGCECAIMGGAMSWVSERTLVSALSEAGAFGVIAASSMPPHLLEAEIKATQALTSKPFGVNLILMHPELEELMQVCIRTNVSHVVLAGGIPKKSTVATLKDADIKVIAFAPTAVIGKKLIQMGVDALVIEGNEAGGHIGPVATSVLAQEILPIIKDVPVFVAGGIGRGEAIASYLEMGASGAQLGTRFVCAEESIAHEHFKQLFIKSSARDATVSVQYHPDFPVIPVRAISNKASEEFMNFQRKTVESFFAGDQDKHEAQLAIEHFWAGALRKAVIDGDVENGSVMAGQSVGMVQRIQPVKEIIDELVSQASEYLG